MHFTVLPPCVAVWGGPICGRADECDDTRSTGGGGGEDSENNKEKWQCVVHARAEWLERVEGGAGCWYIH